jgi:ubiquinone/menaquinone biosynthesis C-methylase UbiE
MSSMADKSAAGLQADRSESTQALFVDNWLVYRKMVDNDYLFHRAAYGQLRKTLLERMQQPFTFLDVACGDASMSMESLKDTGVTHYHGIDISEQALGIARGLLTCPHTLHCGDFASLLQNWTGEAHVVWIGLSLHHLQTDEKRKAMRAIRRIVGDHGLFLIYEDTSPDGEDRDGWLRRWNDQKPGWTAYSEAEWDYVTAHVHSSDFPETDSNWRALGISAGFARASELYASPTNLFRLYQFDA